MEKFNTIDDVLEDRLATDTYMKFLRNNHNEEFVRFWLDLQKYISVFNIISEEKKMQFAKELFHQYIDNQASNQLSQINSRIRKKIEYEMNSKNVTIDMFDEVKSVVLSFMKSNSFEFFNSNEFYLFIITYKSNERSDVCEYNYEWPSHLEKQIITESEKEMEKYGSPSIISKGWGHTPVLDDSNFKKIKSKNDLNTKNNHKLQKNGRNRKYGSSSVFENAPGRTKSNYKVF